MTENLSIQFGQRIIAYELVRSARKAVRIQVHPDGSVRVIAPLDLESEDVTNVVKRKALWIVKQLRFFEQFRPLTPPRQYRSGETHRYLGRQYRLKLLQGEKSVRLVAGFIEVALPDQSPEAVKLAMDLWYRQRADFHFRRILAEALRHFESYSLPVPQLKLRQMPTRWGSCTPSGVVSLHPDLIKTPSGCIEYVIIHELCHLVHHYHNQEFYKLLERILPDWQRRKQTLERMMV